MNISDILLDIDKFNDELSLTERIIEIEKKYNDIFKLPGCELTNKDILFDDAFDIIKDNIGNVIQKANQYNYSNICIKYLEIIKKVCTGLNTIEIQNFEFINDKHNYTVNKTQQNRIFILLLVLKLEFIKDAYNFKSEDDTNRFSRYITKKD
jgi:hypothetical protein